MIDKYPYYKEVNFRNDFSEISYNDAMILYNDRWELYEGLEYPYEFLNLYKTIAVIKDNKLTIYFNSYNEDTKLKAEEYALIMPDSSQWTYYMEAIIKEGQIIKNFKGKQHIK